MRLANHGGMPVIIEGEAVHALVEAGDRSPASFVDVVADWHRRVADLDRSRPSQLDPTRLGPPIPAPGKIVGAPVNYVSHQAEMNVEHTIAGLGFFLKSPSSITGMDGAVPLPFPDRRTDQEAELGVVIGRQARDVALADALDHVFGYTCLVDVTVRGSEERSTRKSFPGFTPIGPWIVTADEIEDPNDLRLQGWVNDELRQDASTSAMIYGVAELIEFVSSVVTLDPGDIIATGTPAGVGPIHPGDVIRVAIERIGTLEVPVVASHREPHRLWLTPAAG